MKKGLTLIITLLLALPMALSAQTYDELWEAYDKKQRNDLPRSAIKVLDSIVVKAEKEKKYGHLLKAMTERANMNELISPFKIKRELNTL